MKKRSERRNGAKISLSGLLTEEDYQLENKSVYRPDGTSGGSKVGSEAHNIVRGKRDVHELRNGEDDNARQGEHDSLNGVGDFGRVLRGRDDSFECGFHVKSIGDFLR